MYSKSFTMLHLLSLLAAALIVAGVGYNWHNLTGAHAKKAEQEALAYVAALRAAGTTVTFVNCNGHDSDHDGYVACSFVVDGKPLTLDCAGKSWLQDNRGCKEYVAKLHATRGTR